MNFEKQGFSEELSGQSILMTVKADVNDGDYISEQYELDAEDFKLLKPIIDKIRTAENHNWEDNSYLTDDEIEVFEEYVPWMDNEEVHTIEEIIIIAYDDQKFSY